MESKSPQKKTLKSSYENIPHISTIAPNLYAFSKEWAFVHRNVVYEDLTIDVVKLLIRRHIDGDDDETIANVLFIYLGPAEDFGISSDAINDGFYDDDTSHIVDELKDAWNSDKEQILRYKNKILKLELIKE